MLKRNIWCNLFGSRNFWDIQFRASSESSLSIVYMCNITTIHRFWCPPGRYFVLLWTLECCPGCASVLTVLPGLARVIFMRRTHHKIQPQISDKTEKGCSINTFLDGLHFSKMTDVFHFLPSNKYFIEYDWAEKQIWLTYCLESIILSSRKRYQYKRGKSLLSSPNKAHSPLGIKLEASPSLSLSWKSSWKKEWEKMDIVPSPNPCYDQRAFSISLTLNPL